MKSLSAGAVTLLVVGSLVLLNLLSLRHFVRIDLTDDDAFTLSQATRTTLAELEDPVTVTAYFSEELPPPFSSNARSVRDLLEEYRAAAHGNLAFEFIDPQAQETSEDKEKKKDVRRDLFGRSVREKTSVETELAKLGIQPVELRVVEEDQAQTRRAYLGLAIRVGEKQEVLPVVQHPETLEYDLTTKIRRLTRKKIPVLGILQGHGEPAPQEGLQRLTLALGQNYDVRPVTLEPYVGGLKVPDPVDALLVIGPKSALDDASLAALDAFLLSGKNAAFFLDRVSVDWKGLATTPVQHGLDKLLAAYGVTLAPEVVGDVECASLTTTERRGSMMVQLPLRYPFIPLQRRFPQDQPLTKGVDQLPLPFASPITTTPRDGLEFTPVVSSSQKSWKEAPTPELLDPRRDFGSAQVTLAGPFDLVVQARGKLPSFAQPGQVGSGESRLVVAGTSAMLDGPLLGQASATLVLNIADWLLLDPALLAMRARGQAEPPLKADLSDGARSAAKAGNVVGAPLLLVAYGLVRWRLREARRRKLAAG